MKRKFPVRTSQLTRVYGVGAMINQKGISMIVAGLDSWFPDDSEQSTGGGNGIAASGSQFFDSTEFILREPRLEARLRVSGFRLPPDFREPQRGGKIILPNTDLTVPVLRFPQWHVCPRCSLMNHLPLTQEGRVFCNECLIQNFHQELVQTTFIAICERGHINEFPWREWAHRTHQPNCTGKLYFVRTGAGTLAGQKIRCSCGASRTLKDVDKARYSDTFLSFYLAPKEGVFLCTGHRPWLGQTTEGKCSAYLLGNPRNAQNVWFSQTVSAINLPRTAESRSAQLAEFLRRPDVAAKIAALSERINTDIPGMLEIFYAAELGDFSEAEIESKLAKILHSDHISDSKQNALQPDVSETEFRYPEYSMLRDSQDEEELLTRKIELPPEKTRLARYFSRLVQVHRLAVTNVFTGFSRIRSDNMLTLEDRKKMLRLSRDEKKQIQAATETDSSGENVYSPNPAAFDWLPAVRNYGEGVYLELNMDHITEWQSINASTLGRHLAPLADAFSKSKRFAGNTDKRAGQILLSGRVSPAFVLIHTLSHLLINQLTFECGYSSAALRERIFFSEDAKTPMAGLLIYTADGDSEGTLGGLVRLATPQNLERLLERALHAARHCSLDPYCSETGSQFGQGLDNSNLAACHACCLLPETSCEEFNKFLDRSLLVSITESVTGFFDL